MMMMTGGQDGAGCDRVGGGGAGVSRQYLCPRREQLFLMPVSMLDWLEEGHLAFFVLDLVGELDTSALHRFPGGSPGRPPYEPEMMFALVLYAYCCGVRSSRRIEASCRTDAAFRVICGGLVPDHATIARFVAGQEPEVLESLFVSGLRLCAAAGLVDLDVVALDGTKIAADAALDRNRDAQWIRGEVAKLIAVTARDEPADTGTVALGGVEALGELSSARGRIRTLERALAVIEAEDATAAAEAIRAQQAAVAQAVEGRHQLGRKPKQPQAALARAEIDYQLARERWEQIQAEVERRRAARARGERTNGPRLRITRAHNALERATGELHAARAAVQSTPAARRTANVTDPDSRIMKTPNGWVQGYNCQAIVNKHQIALACDVTHDTGDVTLYRPMITKLAATLAQAGIEIDVGLALADAGYWSEENATSPGPDRLIATIKDYKQRQAARELGHTNGPPPPNATAIEEMEHLLRTPQGADAYAQRSHLIEPIFGNYKHNRGIRSFRRRGLPGVRSEWTLINLAGNILKLREHRAQAATA